jgi:D-alanyl-D-alanine dipeptidase
MAGAGAELPAGLQSAISLRQLAVTTQGAAHDLPSGGACMCTIEQQLEQDCTDRASALAALPLVENVDLWRGLPSSLIHLWRPSQRQACWTARVCWWHAMHRSP